MQEKEEISFYKTTIQQQFNRDSTDNTITTCADKGIIAAHLSC